MFGNMMFLIWISERKKGWGSDCPPVLRTDESELASPKKSNKAGEGSRKQVSWKASKGTV